MPNYAYLRELISNGWTRQVRNAFTNKLGKNEFTMLGDRYKSFASECPLAFKGSSQGTDIFLTSGLPHL